MQGSEDHVSYRGSAAPPGLSGPLGGAGGAPPLAAPAYPFRFAGNGGEYFRIWIVNLFLSVLTLGIYSAWAKVRREKYFHRNLLLDESGFDYHASPLAILKGRLLAFSAFVLLSVAQHFQPLLYLALLACLVPAVPWLVVRAFRFRAANTSYRGLRFSFHGSYGRALLVFVGLPALIPLTLGLLIPFWLRQQKKFVLDNLRYGDGQFACDAPVGGFYRVFAIAFVILLAAVAGGAFMAGSLFMGGRPEPGAARAFPFLPALAFAGLFLLLQLVLTAYTHVAMTNLVWSHASLDGHRFESRLEFGDYLRLIAANFAMILFTLGLFWPWARVRLWVYRAARLSLVTSGSLENFVAAKVQNAPAAGDEAAEMFDMDVAL